MGSFPNIGPTLLVHIFIICGCLPFLWASECRVQLCSRQYARALDEDRVEQSSSHRYCSLLRAYGDCVRATARSCRGDLAYHSVQSLVAQWTRHFDCGRLLARPPPRASPPRRPIECATPRVDNTPPVHCSLFGDPHLRTFRGELQTCGAPGAWPLLDTPHLAVQATHEPVGRGSPATAITKITVIVREWGPCAQERTYEAQADSLPGVFTDGSRWGGPGVRLREEEPGRHVEILLRHAGTRLALRQVGRHLAFAARMPAALAEGDGDSLQLCARGCPSRERVDTGRLLLRADGEPRRRALAECHSLNVTDFYLDACVFDLLTTGDASFGVAARDAMLDAGPAEVSVGESSASVCGNSLLLLGGALGWALLQAVWEHR